MDFCLISCLILIFDLLQHFVLFRNRTIAGTIAQVVRQDSFLGLWKGLTPVSFNVGECGLHGSQGSIKLKCIWYVCSGEKYFFFI